MVKPKRYVYEHPAEAGLGEHHANPGDPPLDERPAQPPEAVAGIKALIDSVQLSDEARDELHSVLDRTMADLDMAHGTVVSLATDDDGNVVRDEEKNLELVDWTDRHGNPRRISVPPEFFREYFREVVS